jgi:hypothetical protein
MARAASIGFGRSVHSRRAKRFAKFRLHRARILVSFAFTRNALSCGDSFSEPSEFYPHGSSISSLVLTNDGKHHA